MSLWRTSSRRRRSHIGQDELRPAGGTCRRRRGCARSRRSADRTDCSRPPSVRRARSSPKSASSTTSSVTSLMSCVTLIAVPAAAAAAHFAASARSRRGCAASTSRSPCGGTRAAPSCAAMRHVSPSLVMRPLPSRIATRSMPMPLVKLAWWSTSTWRTWSGCVSTQISRPSAGREDAERVAVLVERAREHAECVRLEADVERLGCERRCRECWRLRAHLVVIAGDFSFSRGALSCASARNASGSCNVAAEPL